MVEPRLDQQGDPTFPKRQSRKPHKIDKEEDERGARREDQQEQARHADLAARRTIRCARRGEIVSRAGAAASLTVEVLVSAA